MLPIHQVLPKLQATLEAHTAAVLVAPPGAGKTTGVPLALLEAPWRGDGRILVLEPRRLAARAAAARMASTLGEPVGRTVGYRVRLDARVSAATRIEVVTEGVFTPHGPGRSGSGRRGRGAVRRVPRTQPGRRPWPRPGPRRPEPAPR